jgi:hypothetical protein
VDSNVRPDIAFLKLSLCRCASEALRFVSVIRAANPSGLKPPELHQKRAHPTPTSAPTASGRADDP